MLLNALDKTVFAIAVFLALQVPSFSDHYLQFVSGQYDTLKSHYSDIDGIAKKYGFNDAHEFVSKRLESDDPISRDQAEVDQKRIYEYEDAETAIEALKNGSYYGRLFFILNPAKLDVFKKVWKNYRISVVISGNDILYSFLTAFLFSAVLCAPFKLFKRKKSS